MAIINMCSESDAHHGDSSAPKRLPLRLALRGRLHHVALDAGQPIRHMTLASARDLHSVCPSCSAISHPVSGQQHDACALRQPHARELVANQSLQLGSLLFGQRDLRGNSHSRSLSALLRRAAWPSCAPEKISAPRTPHFRVRCAG